MTEETNSPVPAKVKHIIMLSPPVSQIVKEIAQLKGLSDSELLRGWIEQKVEAASTRAMQATYIELKT
tara:strand:+ start:181 stop:384 length:204 start_codon:yes stop_codon:yes gene_type:complete